MSGHEARRVLEVLDADGDAGEGTGVDPGRHLLVDGGSSLESTLAVHRHERVEARVVSVDASQCVTDELACRLFAGPHASGQLGEVLGAEVHRRTVPPHVPVLNPSPRLPVRDGLDGDGVERPRCAMATDRSQRQLRPGSSIDGAVLDHVAHAVPRWQDAWTRYAVDLGARWKSGGAGVGFSPAQLSFGNGARLELLMPGNVEDDDFLARFLDRHGPGPHHLTFKVPDLDVALAAATAAGYSPIGIDRSEPGWQEAFLSPREATGVVVQLAQAAHEWVNDPPPDFPAGARTGSDGTPLPAAHLELVVHAVARLAEGLDLFAGLLGGTEARSGEEDGVAWAELRWGGPLGLRLVAPADSDPVPVLRTWLGDRSGRVHHLQLAVAEPAGVTGAQPSTLLPVLVAPPGPPREPSPAHGTAPSEPLEVRPADNEGLRLVLRPGAG